MKPSRLLGIAFALIAPACSPKMDKPAAGVDTQLWGIDVPKAIETAAAEKKRVFINFSGSDWCELCLQMDKEVFSQPQFQEYAKKNLVLVKLDFPHKKPLPADVVKRQEALARLYQIEGWPTYIVLNADGKELGELNFTEGGPAKFIEALNALPKG